jgi:uncharacterized protein YbjT (DUF2867 family)
MYLSFEACPLLLYIKERAGKQASANKHLPGIMSQAAYSQSEPQTKTQSQSQSSSAATAAGRHKRIFVTGASGQTGSHVLKHLSAAAKERKQSSVASQLEILAGVYAPQRETAEKCVRECCEDAKIVPIDADDVDELIDAFRGVDDLFIVPTATEHKVHHARNYLRAAKRAGVKFVLLLSMSGAEARSHLFADQFRDIEETLLREGLEGFCVLRSSFYMQNLLLYRDELRQGSLPLPVHQGVFNPVDADDVGKAARRILEDCHKHVGKWYNIAGPEKMNATAMARAVGEALGTQIQWKDIPRSEARSILMRQQVPNIEATGLLEFYDRVAKGMAAEQEKNDFQAITGEEPTKLVEFFKRHRGEIMASAA